MAKSAYTRKYSATGIVIAVIIVVAAIIVGWWAFRHAEYNPMSEEGALDANIVNVAATVPGRIIKIDVSDNQRVKKGAALFSIDPKSFQLAVAQATADLQMAEAARDNSMRTISAEQSNSAVAAEQIRRAQNNLALAESTLSRLQSLAPMGYVTKEQVDSALTARNNARISLAQAGHQSAAAQAVVNKLDVANAMVAARQAALAVAERELAQTTVYAPHDGVVVGLNVGPGEVIAPGQPLFTLIDTSRWYAVATFPETKLRHIRIGDCAKVYVMENSQHPLYGRVQSIGWGVHSANSPVPTHGLPIVSNSLKWVQTEQRFPVRILLDNPPQDLMRIGASITAIIHDGKSCEPVKHS
ncbi:MAG: multidrug transporter subunit MdtN [Candidatus Igneacidithiobacillus chanchocoensis]